MSKRCLPFPYPIIHYRKNVSEALSSIENADRGGLLSEVLISPLAGLRSACDMVSTITSPLIWPCELRVGLFGLPKSKPFILGAPLVGGLGPAPWLDVGERTGDGDRLRVEEARECEVRCNWLRASEGRPAVCSAWTTSAKEMNDRRRGSVVSILP